MLLNPTKKLIQIFQNQLINYKIIVCFILVYVAVSCSSLAFNKTKKNIKRQFQSQNYTPQHTGFLVVDLETRDTLIDVNASKYFIPASTVKLFTLYTSLQLLPETIPSMKYINEGDKIHVLGTGDPTWLHPYFKNDRPIQFLKQLDSIFIYLNNYPGEKFGPGWAWEDYSYSFSPEMTPIPLYGNVVEVTTNDSLEMTPSHFRTQVTREQDRPLRDWRDNQFHVPIKNQDTLIIPSITSNTLTKELLSEETQQEVLSKDTFAEKNWNILYGISRDSVLKRMLWESDNFLAEQLMLLSSSVLSDTLDFNRAKEFVLEQHVIDLYQSPRWVDGSGLSRYNLFTPKAMVTLLDHLYKEIDSAQLFALMPQWFPNGTLNHTERQKTPSFIMAKSGSMGNVYYLCGYLQTQSGKLLAFSFMNNHFRRPSLDVRNDMYQILNGIHQNY